MAKVGGIAVLLFTACLLGTACTSSDDEGPSSNPDPPPLGEASASLNEAQMRALERWAATMVAQADNPLCWRRSYGRGAGEALSSCPQGERDGALCYPVCDDGYDGVGPVCWQDCKSGYTDDGAFCRKDVKIVAKDSYGRGAGYASWDKDKCIKEHGTCEVNGGLYYPTCERGYEAIGCCICREKRCPSGYIDDGALCRKDAHIYAKHTYGRGAGSPMSCSGGLEQSGALCYPKCRSGFDGVGPVCWGSCPATQPFNCGAACARTEEHCGYGIAEMLLAPIEVVENILTMVVSGGTINAAKVAIKSSLKNAAKTGGKAGVRSALRNSDQLEMLTSRVSFATGVQLEKEFGEAVAQSVAETVAENILIASLIHDDVEMSELLADIDPTGVAALVDAFNHPLCLDGRVPNVAMFADAKHPSNLARRRPAAQSSTNGAGFASLAVDTETSGPPSTTNSEERPWWKVDLGHERWIGRVAVHRVAEAGIYPDLRLVFSDAEDRYVSSRVVYGGASALLETTLSVPARFVRVERVGAGVLSLAEVEINESELAGSPEALVWLDLAAGAPATQSSTAGVGTADRANDGKPDTTSQTNVEDNAWWMVDLGREVRVENVVVDGELTDFDVVLLDENGKIVARRKFEGSLAGIDEIGVTERAQYVRIELRGRGAVKLTRVSVNTLRPNLALSKDARQSSMLSAGTSASKAVDGDTSKGGTAITASTDTLPWWEVDLGRPQAISRVKLHGPAGSLSNLEIVVSDEVRTCTKVNQTQVCWQNRIESARATVRSSGGSIEHVHVGAEAKGRYVRVRRQLPLGLPISLHEVQVF